MIFDDRLISKGESGGKEAATILWDSVSQYVQSHMTNLSLGYRIVTRVYANLKGLGDVCHRSGITDRLERIEEFARGFTGSKQLFDFVDVGMGKDRADDKIIGEKGWVPDPNNCADNTHSHRNIQITYARLSLPANTLWLLSR